MEPEISLELYYNWFIFLLLIFFLLVLIKIQIVLSNIARLESLTIYKKSYFFIIKSAGPAKFEIVSICVVKKIQKKIIIIKEITSIEIQIELAIIKILE